MRKERFLEQRKSKIQPRGDRPFQVLERINDNAYKVELPGEYNVSSTFNVSDLSLFDADGESDLRTNYLNLLKQKMNGSGIEMEVDKERKGLRE